MTLQEQSKAISIRVKHAHRNKYKNQRRHDLRIGHQPAYVDCDRIDQNRVVVEHPTPAEIAARAKELRERSNPTRGMRDDAAIATIGIITFGMAAQPIFEALSPAQQDEAYLDVAARIAEEYGTNVRGLVVHADETAPHAHAVWDCRNHEGVPMSRVMKGSRLQDIAAEVIAKHAPEIVRGVRKSKRIELGDKPSQIYNRSVQQLHDDLPLEIEAKRKVVDGLKARAEEMQARVAQLLAKEALNAKEEKRLMVYRKRLNDREAELDVGEAELAEFHKRLQWEDEALKIQARGQMIAEEKFDVREDALDDREEEVALREAEVTRREGILERMNREVSKLIVGVADQLGVGRSLRAILERLRVARNDLEDDGPSME